MNYFLETYGCQMNTAESAALMLVLKERGWSQVKDGEGADLVLINTCSVRATAEQRVLGRLAQYGALKKKQGDLNKSFTLVVAGCMASRLGETLKEKVPAVDYCMGTADRAAFPLLLEALEGGKRFLPAREGEKPVFSFSASHLEEGGVRSFIPIMHGCNNFCSYCIVPHTRGREVSRSPHAILEEIRLVSERGVREITLLGQNVNSYRWEGEEPGFPETSLSFPALLELIAREIQKTPIRWVRFLSSHPKDLSSQVIRIMAENPVFCRHLHLCVQHGSNAILSAMNRRYTREGYLELVAEIREAIPGITLSTDLLIGFPGETEEDLAQTLELMEQVRFLYAYMYYYNPREGTAAFNLPNPIDRGIIRKRLSQVIELQKQHRVELLKSRIGCRERVLIEGVSRRNAHELIARTERDEMVVIPGTLSMIGSFADLTLSSLQGNTFRAKEVCLCLGD